MVEIALCFCSNLDYALVQIKSLGAKAGVVLNPGTSLAQIEYVLDCKEHSIHTCITSFGI